MSVAGEASEIRFGATRIRYSIRRSDRRRTVSIAVEGRGEVLVTAPSGVSVERLDRVVLAKGPWVVEKLRRRSDAPPPLPAREYLSGETFLYLGRQVRLRVEAAKRSARAGEAGAAVALRGGHLVVGVAEGLTGPARAAAVRKALVSWYRAHAGERLPERAALWAAQLGLPAPAVLVRAQQKRWGSCDARGVVRFNWRVIQAPMPLVDYVVAHELVHLRHADHTREFWATLGRAMPDYEARREALRAMGGRLEW